MKQTHAHTLSKHLRVGPKLVTVAPNGINLGFFKISFKYILALQNLGLLDQFSVHFGERHKSVSPTNSIRRPTWQITRTILTTDWTDFSNVTSK